MINQTGVAKVEAHITDAVSKRAKVSTGGKRSKIGGTFFARDAYRIWRVAEALETGMVGVNTDLISTEVALVGGIKQSSVGREGAKYGIEDFLELKNICLGGIA